MLYENQIINKTYMVIREIGSGGMGVVYLAYHLRLEKYIVLKKIKGTNLDYSMIRNEVDILKTLHHPYLPQVYDFIYFENDIYTVIDYINGYDLKYYIDAGYNFTEGQLIKWLVQMCEVLSYLHSQKPPVLHTDIKPANIIITEEGNICLIDFGISLNNNYDVKGLSKNYSSPEQYYNVGCVMNGQKESCIALTVQTDIYSTGATFYHIMTGRIPSLDFPNPKLSEFNTNYSDEFVGIIEKAFQSDVRYRFKSAEQMYKAVLNIRKQNSRYKKYIAAQITSLTVTLSIIICGIFMVYFGYKGSVVSSYESLYSSFFDMYRMGDYEGAINKGNEIINNSEYKSIIDPNSLADTMYGIGESCYNIDDYDNAEYYLKNALEICDNDQNKEKYYEKYILACIKNNKLDTAEQLLEEMQSKYPDTDFVNVINAYISFHNGSYEEAIKYSQLCTESSADNDDLYLSNIIKGESCEKLFDYDGAANAFEQALQSKEDIYAIRKCGNALLMQASENNYRELSLIRSARDMFIKIYQNYYYSVDDVINLAQCYRLLGEDSTCVKFLSEYINAHEVSDFRVYMHLSISADELEDQNTETYCEKAYDLYMKMDKSSRMDVESADLNVLKNLYEKHCKSNW